MALVLASDVPRYLITFSQHESSFFRICTIAIETIVTSLYAPFLAMLTVDVAFS